MKEVSWGGRSHRWGSPRTLPWCVGVSGRLKHGHLPDLLQAQERRNSKRENRKRGERKGEKEEEKKRERERSDESGVKREKSELANKRTSGQSEKNRVCQRVSEWKSRMRVEGRPSYTEGPERKGARERERGGILGRKQLLVRCNENISRPFRNRPTSVRRV